MPVSMNKSRMSFNRQSVLFKKYSLSPERNTRRVIVTSLYSEGRIPFVFSMVMETSATFNGLRDFVPLKITSSILSDRSVVGRCSPNTQRIASTTFVLPQPFGPTIAVSPWSNDRFTFWANDLKPNISNVDKYIIRGSVRDEE
jgi:hypothetical protein